MTSMTEEHKTYIAFVSVYDVTGKTWNDDTQKVSVQELNALKTWATSVFLAPDFVLVIRGKAVRFNTRNVVTVTIAFNEVENA